MVTGMLAKVFNGGKGAMFVRLRPESSAAAAVSLGEVPTSVAASGPGSTLSDWAVQVMRDSLEDGMTCGT
jgi:hypothetical protein